MKGSGQLSSSAKRIQKELAEISLDPPCNCSAGPKGDNIYEWVSTIMGPSSKCTFHSKLEYAQTRVPSFSGSLSQAHLTKLVSSSWTSTSLQTTHSNHQRSVAVLSLLLSQTSHNQSNLCTLDCEISFTLWQVTFRTRIYHCNINSSGQICLDILKDQWSPALTVSKVLLSVCSLLTDPNPGEPSTPHLAHSLLLWLVYILPNASDRLSEAAFPVVNS